ncbi:hypothetical protein BDQ12DRAFT_753735 [Crucibulum laeve]|uniref:Uncharacterized protein n=1 Tax=Crucibulum laeve TaxID=68775 RepID=A0A5C3LVR2_9AGAR|nr:hypothetical protein BDQ12DRAFT_753735 [Crucibulum laeve]
MLEKGVASTTIPTGCNDILEDHVSTRKLLVGSAILTFNLLVSGGLLHASLKLVDIPYLVHLLCLLATITTFPVLRLTPRNDLDAVMTLENIKIFNVVQSILKTQFPQLLAAPYDMLSVNLLADPILIPMTAKQKDFPIGRALVILRALALLVLLILQLAVIYILSIVVQCVAFRLTRVDPPQKMWKPFAVVWNLLFRECSTVPNLHRANDGSYEPLDSILKQ